MKDKTAFSKQLKMFFGRYGKAVSIVCFCVFTVCILGTGALQTYRKTEAERELLKTVNEGPYEDTVQINIKGAVNSAGVYELPGGSRVSDAINAAGGLTGAADGDGFNPAQLLENGDEIVIPSRDAQEKDADGKININTAAPEELASLEGIGDATAQKIIGYREAHGLFTSLTQLKNIDGIGDKTFKKIKNSICLE